MTKVRPLSAQLTISTQVDPGDLPSLARAGYRAIICNRPDGEDPGQPTWAEIAEAATSAGMIARHIPVTPGAISEDDVARFSAAIDESPGPVLAYCRTGGRAASLWGLSQVGKLTPDEIIRAAANAGCDLSPLRERLSSV